MGKIERKYLAHFIDASFGGTTTDYERLGKDLESFAEELNPQTEVRRNILGEQNVNHQGYQVQSSVEPYYCYEDEPLFEQLAKIANERLTGDDCKTTRVELLMNADGTAEWAYREDCYVVPQSVGGDTSGVQIPFQVLNCGNRVAGTMVRDTTNSVWVFTPTTT